MNPEKRKKNMTPHLGGELYRTNNPGRMRKVRQRQKGVTKGKREFLRGKGN